MREEYEGYPDDLAFHEMMHLFHDLTFSERVKKTIEGLKAPKDSGSYKFAKLQLQRLMAPVTAVLSVTLLFALAIIFAEFAPQDARAIPTVLKTPDEPPELEEIPPPEQQEIDEPIDPDFETDIVVDNPVPQENTPLSPNPVEIDAVAITRSPVTMTGVFGNRNPGLRGAAIARYGGTSAGERAVLRALRWLKVHQNSDGSWDNGSYRTSMTALALLTYLAHGELPDENRSPEFADAVRRAIDFLVDSQTYTGMFSPRDGHNYTHPIATYALCEAYALTQVPRVGEAAEKAVVHVIKGQTAAGGWDYNMKAQSTRNDTSYMGWCAQALKAAKMADLSAEGLDAAMKKAIKGFEGNATDSGGFGYTSPGNRGLTGVGVLCLQLLGDGDSEYVKRGLQLLQPARLSWENWQDQPYSSGRCPIYYWYYITQAKFHEGGGDWNSWNAHFNPELVRTQIVETGKYVDHKGIEREIGHWVSPSEGEHGPGEVMDTTLCTLQLEVYYRNLPTFKKPEVAEEKDFVEVEDDAPEIVIEF